jgi:DNA-directed RNA polymerase subunit delta
MKKLSMLDVAYDVLHSKKELTFKQLFDHVSKKLDFNDEEKAKKMAKFYTSLTLDGRFVALGDNTWDLRENQKFDKVHIDISEIYTEAEEEVDDEEVDDEDREELGESDSDEDREIDETAVPDEIAQYVGD